MKRVGLVLVVILLAGTAVTACGSKKPATTAGPTTPRSGAVAPASPPSTSPSPNDSPADLFEFSVDGAGPYKLGMTLTALQASPGLSDVGTGGACPGNTTARGTGNWGDVEMSFRNDGKLYLVHNKSINIPTPSGAYLGTGVADLKRIYAGVGGSELTHGTDSAYLVVTLSGGGVLFVLDSTKKVSSMYAGDSSFLRSNFQGGTNFC